MADSNLGRRGSTGSSASTFKDLRCHHCSGPLSKEMETSHWTVAPLIRDSFSMIGSAVGGTASAFYGFNHVMPIVRRSVKGPMWLHFFIGAPPVIVFSSACAGLAGGAVPAFAQLLSSSYHAAVSSHSLPPQTSKDDKIRNFYAQLCNFGSREEVVEMIEKLSSAFYPR
ncbi:hypothetical protein L6164_018952 [Bauhinia variegata]|uniref:Uncharacterized protein n=1 Tax=Bauhinia variegata TaxID=167791 RepID=A0ACB9NDC2_BAUVA|nr:hypothetical protein L6164_018952 [Bauhinia variegata]